MPQYEYACLDCKQSFSIVLSLKEFEAGKAACPHCHSKNVKQILAGFFAKTSRKS